MVSKLAPYMRCQIQQRRRIFYEDEDEDPVFALPLAQTSRPGERENSTIADPGQVGDRPDLLVAGQDAVEQQRAISERPEDGWVYGF
jgi:hypothetical protein